MGPCTDGEPEMTIRELIDLVDPREMPPETMRELIGVIDLDRAKPATMRGIIRDLTSSTPQLSKNAALSAQYGDAHTDALENLELRRLSSEIGKLDADAALKLAQRAGIKRES